MSCGPLVSDLVRQIHDRIAIEAKVGIWLHPEACINLMRNLRKIEELALNDEEEIRLLEAQVHNRPPMRRVPIEHDGNVVRLPIKPRVVVPRPDGGDAA